MDNCWDSEFNKSIKIDENCKDKQIRAEQFNSFFVSIGELNGRNIRKHNGSHFKDYLTIQTDCHFSFNTNDNTETLRILKNIIRSGRILCRVYLKFIYSKHDLEKNTYQ